MMFRGRVAAVSYLNTIPFIYGIEHARLMRAVLLLSPPSRCVTAFADGSADIALVPAAAVPELPDARIVTSFCIGASAPVRTVSVMSNGPVESAKRIFLDAHSRTSVLLTKILCRELWHTSPDWVDMQDYSVTQNPQPGDAFLFIGDKVFDYENRFAYRYDLAECWEKMTGLPFVFALWIARDNVPASDIEALQASLRYGIDHIKEAIGYYGHSGKEYAWEYLTKNLDFILDEPKRQAFSLFLEKAEKLDTIYKNAERRNNNT